MNEKMEQMISMAGRVFDNEGSEEEDVIVAGQTNLMSFSELSDVQSLRELFEAFNHKRDMYHVLERCISADGVQIFIGQESGYDVLDMCSLVTSPYEVDGEMVGILGVVGPTRMAYDRVVPVVDLTSKLLSAALNSSSWCVEKLLMSDDKAAVEAESEENGAEFNADNAAEKAADMKNDAGNPAADTDGLSENDLASELSTADAAESAPEAETGDELSELKAQLEQASAKADENMDLALRTRAEMENLRKRQSRELENAHKYALDKMAEELLPVRDTLELGVAAAAEEQADLSKVVEGTELTLKMLTQALEKFNILEVNPVGDKFDPDLHQAISVQEGTDKPANTVLNVMQKGYTLNDRLLRPAMVVLAK